jgi:hypothetical protein
MLDLEKLCDHLFSSFQSNQQQKEKKRKKQQKKDQAQALHDQGVRSDSVSGLPRISLSQVGSSCEESLCRMLASACDTACSGTVQAKVSLLCESAPLCTTGHSMSQFQPVVNHNVRLTTSYSCQIF